MLLAIVASGAVVERKNGPSTEFVAYPDRQLHEEPQAKVDLNLPCRQPTPEEKAARKLQRLLNSGAKSEGPITTTRRPFNDTAPFSGEGEEVVEPLFIKKNVVPLCEDEDDE